MIDRLVSARIKCPPQAVESFQADVVAGLSAWPKHLSCKYFYDRRGSKLFDAICDLDEYYLTRCELEIMHRYAPQMAQAMGACDMLIEYGSGSSIKTRLLLEHLQPVAYVPVDISEKHLFATARRLSRRYPHIEILPAAADFTDELELPRTEREPARRIAYFPGSTIGNFEEPEAIAFLSRLAHAAGPAGGALIGIDLQKDIAIIEAAYNDAQGVTAEFNLNLLRRINHELGGNFDLEQFLHLAFYDPFEHRMDIRLVSLCDQTVELGPRTFHFAAGEPIHTEYSHKYTIAGFAKMAAATGLSLRQCWTDRRDYFAVLYFEASGNMPDRSDNDPTHNLRRKKPR